MTRADRAQLVTSRRMSRDDRPCQAQGGTAGAGWSSRQSHPHLRQQCNRLNTSTQEGSSALVRSMAARSRRPYLCSPPSKAPTKPHTKKRPENYPEGNTGDDKRMGNVPAADVPQHNQCSDSDGTNTCACQGRTQQRAGKAAIPSGDGAGSSTKYEVGNKPS